MMRIDQIANLISEDITVNSGIRKIDIDTDPDEVRDLLDGPLSKHMYGIEDRYAPDVETEVSGRYQPATMMEPAEGPDITVKALGLIDAYTGDQLEEGDYSNQEINIETNKLIAENPELLGDLSPEELVEIMRRSLPLKFSFGGSATVPSRYGEMHEIELEKDITWTANAVITQMGESADDSVPALFNIADVSAHD